MSNSGRITQSSFFKQLNKSLIGSFKDKELTEVIYKTIQFHYAMGGIEFTKLKVYAKEGKLYVK